MNPRNTVFDAKRLIGRLYNDKTVQDDMKVRSNTSPSLPPSFPASLSHPHHLSLLRYSLLPSPSPSLSVPPVCSCGRSRWSVTAAGP